MPLWRSIIVFADTPSGASQCHPAHNSRHQILSLRAQLMLRTFRVSPDWQVAVQLMKQCLHVAGLQEAVPPLRELSGAAQL